MNEKKKKITTQTNETEGREDLIRRERKSRI